MTTDARPARRRSRRALLVGGATAVLAACAAGPSEVARIEARNPPRGRFVEADGVRVHYRLDGPETGPAAVLIHGATGNLNDMTFDLAPRLVAAGWRVAAFDRPGLGYTPRIPGAWRPRTQARLLRAAAAKLGLERPVVLGHSWGAAVALAWALDAPEAVTGVAVISGATMPWREGGDAPLTPLITSGFAARVGVGLLRTFALEDDGRGAAERIFRPQPVPEGYLDHLQAELILRPDSFRANTADIQKLNGALRTQAEGYRDLDVPVEILHGRADEVTPPPIHAEGLAEALPRAELRRLDGVGHMLHHARPEAVVEAMARLAERGGASRPPVAVKD